MAEGKSSGSKNFGKVLQKTVFRTKEKVLQNLGKSEKTQDEKFDEHVEDFNKQQLAATKFQKELKNYIQVVKAMQLASKVFYETVLDLYEEEWTGRSDMFGAVEALSNMWEDYVTKLTNQVQDPISGYVNKFPELKHKISKRNRKLMDYDGTRHVRDSLVNQKKKDEAKINKAHDEMNAAKKIYNEINSEMHEELPKFYESRKSVYSSSFNSLFSTEAKFQEESAKIKNTLSDATERLNRECGDVFFRQYNHSPNVSSSDRGSVCSSTPPGASKYPKRIPHSSLSDRSNSIRSNHSDAERKQCASSSDTETCKQGAEGGKDPEKASGKKSGKNTKNTTLELAKVEDNIYEDDPTKHAKTNGNLSLSPEIDPDFTPEDTYENVMLKSLSTQNTIVPDDDDDDNDVNTSDANVIDLSKALNNNESNDHSSSDEDNTSYTDSKPNPADIYEVPSSKPVNPNILYMVVATHPYAGEDIDELTFEVGDRINVIAYDDPEEQDDGWLMGIKLPDGEKGVFPENFTTRI